MPFITQGKTSLKYILIVVVLAVVVGGGILGWQYWLMPKGEIEMPEVKVPREIMQINIYFHNQELQKEVCPEGICPEGLDDCTLVFPVRRTIPKTEAIEVIAAAAINELLKGPTEEEENQGFNSWIPDVDQIARYSPQMWWDCEGEEFRFQKGRVALLSLKIKNGTAYVDFSGEIHAYGGGSCYVGGIGSEIDNTLKQLPLVKEVVVSVDGETECILQP